MSTPFVWSRPLEFHETDLAGIAHFANFYHWMEAAEHAFLKACGIDIHQRIDGREIGWPRVQTECQHQRPLRFGDHIEVTLRVAELKTRSIRYAFEIRAAGHDELCATGSLTAVCVAMDDGQIHAIKIPDSLRSKLS